MRTEHSLNSNVLPFVSPVVRELAQQNIKGKSITRRKGGGIDRAISIANKVMCQLFADDERQLAKGAERVWNALITAKGAGHEQRF